MIPILTRQWTLPTDLALRAKDGLTATYKGVKAIRDMLADFIEKVSTQLTNYHTVDVLVNRPPAGQLGRHFYATDTNLLYEDIGTMWVAIGGPGFTMGVLVNETPAGTVDGVNTIFTTSVLPITNTQELFRNGVLQEPGMDYVLIGQTITFANPPIVNDVLRIVYWTA